MSSQQFLKFEYLTLVPFCRKLIDEALLEPRELCWVNEYHETLELKLHALSGHLFISFLF